jgi:hypothetical protein
MSDSWHSYPSIYAIGHPAVAELLQGNVCVEEKIDGSQFSFGFFEGALRVRSKGQEMVVDAPEKMFDKAVDSVKERAKYLHEGWTYRAEYLRVPRHNGLAYSRVPNGHLIVFDVNTDHECYLPYGEKQAEAARIGLECVPLIYQGIVATAGALHGWLDMESCLGGPKIEGVVVKPLGYGLFGRDKKTLMGKFVSEAYKEEQRKTWKVDNPSGKDILDVLGERFATKARWLKAVQHLRERGELESSPVDIGKLLREIPVDIAKEQTEAIKDALFAWAWPHVRRSCTRGFPEWYKLHLAESAFTLNDEGQSQ